jgi:hypothetical protein
VRKSHSRMLADCARRNSAQLGSSRFGAGSTPRLLEDRPDRARGERDPEPDQLALDPPIPPTRILPGEPHGQLANLSRGCRPTRTPVGIRSSGAGPTPGASAEPSPASRTTIASTPPAARRGSTPPESPDQPASPAAEQPAAPTPEAGGGAAGSRSPSPAPSENAAPPAPAAAATTNTQTTERSPANGPPRALTPPVRRQTHSGMPIQSATEFSAPTGHCSVAMLKA